MRVCSLVTGRRVAMALLLSGLTLPALALYKVVGPDGRVTYTDRPAVDDKSRVTTIERSGAVNEVPSPQDLLPQQLRQASARYPVVLYGARDCPPCETGRQLLQQRGIPFTEKLIVTEDDAVAMERAIATRTVPSLSIGTQALRGLSEQEWSAYLDAAGYPRESQLPKSWQAPAATPMVARPAEPASAAARTPARPPRPEPAAPLPPAQPASGIRF